MMNQKEYRDNYTKEEKPFKEHRDTYTKEENLFPVYPPYIQMSARQEIKNVIKVWLILLAISAFVALMDIITPYAPWNPR